MNKYEECAKELDSFFKEKGFKPYGNVAGQSVFSLAGHGKTNMYFYLSNFKGNKNFTNSFLNSEKAMKLVVDVILPILKKWDIENDNFMFSPRHQKISDLIK